MIATARKRGWPSRSPWPQKSLALWHLREEFEAEGAMFEFVPMIAVAPCAMIVGDQVRAPHRPSSATCRGQVLRGAPPLAVHVLAVADERGVCSHHRSTGAIRERLRRRRSPPVVGFGHRVSLTDVSVGPSSSAGRLAEGRLVDPVVWELPGAGPSECEPERCRRDQHDQQEQGRLHQRRPQLLLYRRPIDPRHEVRGDRHPEVRSPGNEDSPGKRRALRV